MTGVALRLITLAELALDASRIEVPDDISCVIGIPRSGMLPAAMLATRLHLPLGMAGCPTVHGGARIAEDAAKDGRILLVDDSVWTGSSMRDALGRLGVDRNRVVTCAIYVSEDERADTYAHVVPAPRVFEWNLFNSWATGRLMLDMDGVVCMDPVVFDDDGPLYAADISTAAPRHVPRLPARAIATNRIERWRGVTEEWLARHGAKYGRLHMRHERTAAERRAAADPAAYKAAIFKEDRDAWLFVESHDAQAERIAGLAQKPVLSIESVSLFQGRN